MEIKSNYFSLTQIRSYGAENAHEFSIIITNWCEENNIQYKNFIYGAHYYSIEEEIHVSLEIFNKEDAMKFKLVWG